MRVAVTKIGNDRTVRLPERIVAQCGIGDEVELEVVEGRVVLSAPPHPRAGWAEAFRAMPAAGDDAPLLAEDSRNDFDATEWRW
jgi:antitoxin MazE